MTNLSSPTLNRPSTTMILKPTAFSTALLIPLSTQE